MSRLNVQQKLWVLVLVPMLSFALAFPASAAQSHKRKNPFSLPKGVYLRSGLPKKEKPRLVLEAVILTGSKRVATINNRNYVKGDLAFGKKVVDILEDRVILRDRGKKMVLPLKQPDFSIRVRQD